DITWAGAMKARRSKPAGNETIPTRAAPGTGVASPAPTDFTPRKSMEARMYTKRKKAARRRPNTQARRPVPAERVQELLLELAFRLHATRPVATLPRPTGSVA